jgi:RHS repeat-associated protein
MHLSNYHFYSSKNYLYSNPVKGLQGCGVDYGFSFNGKEKDNEVKGDGNQQDFGLRTYDNRLGRFLSVDPMENEMPAWSPYSFCFNNPISFIDPTGAIPYPITIRSFAPFESFGFGFHGDNRGYSSASSNPGIKDGPTARAHQRILFDTDKKDIFAYGWSSPTFKTANPDDAATANPTVTLTKGFAISEAGDVKAFVFGTHSAASNPKTPQGVTPNIDVFSNFTIVENKKKGTLSISGTLTGDNFPSTEAFISDTKGKNVFIGIGQIGANVGVNTGPFTELPRENENNSITSFNFTITTDKKGNFTGVIEGNKTYTLEAWNKKFTDTKPQQETK